MDPTLVKELSRLYLTVFGAEPEHVSALNAHASNRQMFRLAGAKRSVIGVVNRNQSENRAFIEFSRHFRSLGLPVPEVYGASDDQCMYLEQDLGDTTLFDLLSSARSAAGPFPAAIEDQYRKVVELLPQFQIVAGRTINYECCYPRMAYDRESILWDMSYFSDSFVSRTALKVDHQKLERDFNQFATFLEQAGGRYFMYRD